MHVAMSPFLPTSHFKRFLLRLCGIDLPRSSYIGAGTIIGSNLVKIGSGVLVNVRSHLDGAAPIILENNVTLGFGVTVITGTHDLEASVVRVDRSQPTVARPVLIGRGSWIGANTTILPGVTIGEGCVVAAGSVVTRDLDANTLYAGIPASKVRDLPTGCR